MFARVSACNDTRAHFDPEPRTAKFWFTLD